MTDHEPSDQLFSELQTLILSHADFKACIKSASITRESRLAEDLGFDSIMLIAFLCELQDRFPNVTLDESHLIKWKSLDDVLLDLKAGTSHGS